MRNLFAVCLCFSILVCSAQGRFAGSYRSLIGKKFFDEKQLTPLNNFTSRGGSVLGNPGGEADLSVSWYSKGNLIVALYESRENSTKEITVIDVLEIKNVQKNQELAMGVCTDGENEMPGLVALVQPSSAKRYKAIQAWNFNLDKIRIESWSADKVTCLGAVGED
ncbi:MAG: hypothetical protein OJF59_000814 [Cytophagales bacterium]|jgi:hypothetical protein|nr:hypothetical protein [Bacteroidota bacterium]MBS1979805.1 hypothetical protein [Bacteroidota bacterium]WHZ07061.1 MAG: hypothetical protein OJF59_000814 [Cytophagales bacterium]